MTLDQIVQAIKSLYPYATRINDYTVSVDVAGNASLSLWNNALGAQPTVDEMQTALDGAQLLTAKQIQASVIEAAYQAHIGNGFTSAALGESYLYPSATTDQANLTAVITASMIPGQPANWTSLFWCAPVSAQAAWNYLPHTAPQIQKVGMDAMAYIMAAKMQRAQRGAQIQAAATVAEVQAIVW